MLQGSAVNYALKKKKDFHPNLLKDKGRLCLTFTLWEILT